MGKYLGIYENATAIQSALNNGELLKPYVAFDEDTETLDYNSRRIEYSKKYLTFTALEDGTFASTNNYSSLNYSLDGGSTWQTLAHDTQTPTVQAGNKILLKGNISPSQTKGIGTITSTGRFEAEGNIMSLLFSDNFSGQTSLSSKKYAFTNLFYNCTGLTNVENLIIPATTLSNECYKQMFRGCTYLTTAPTLPATTLALNCYDSMFRSCTSLTTAPVLPAITLIYECYVSMFEGCTSLTTAPELQATTLAERCYRRMFYGCTSLTAAPVLQATTLANGCYQFMFASCTSLATAPELPATTLANGCYNGMLRDCTNLNYIKCLATDISATDCTKDWVVLVASTGTFVKDASMNDWTIGESGIPSNWTVIDA